MYPKLTSSELNVIRNSEFFYTKASATKKIDALFARTRDEIKSVIEKRKVPIPKEADSKTGKIFRGESYLGLPYLVLDYPKHFSKDSVFAFRTMFWWGKFFSCTLHLQGKALVLHRNNLARNAEQLKKKDFFICTGSGPWDYHYEKENYTSIDKVPAKKLREMIGKKSFIKLSRKTGLQEYRNIPVFAKETFAILSSLL